MATRADTYRGRRLLLFAVAVGVVGMHHLLIACSSGTGAMPMARAITLTASQFERAVEVTPISSLAIGSLASPNPEPTCCDEMAGHPCLAVLTAAAALLFGLLMAFVAAFTHPKLARKPGSLAVAARAPPRVRLPLAVLCVWRC